MSTQLKSVLPRKLVVVVGTTGGQGGSVISRLLADGSYRLRGITRNTQSKSSQALTSKGVEMVTADLNDTDSVIAAFKGANIIFAFTNFFEPFATSGPEVTMQVEYTQGVNLAKASSATTNLDHFVWSTLPDRKAISNGKWTVPHCDGKAQVDVFIKKGLIYLLKQDGTYLRWGRVLVSEVLHRPYEHTDNALTRSPFFDVPVKKRSL